MLVEELCRERWRLADKELQKLAMLFAFGDKNFVLKAGGTPALPGASRRQGLLN
ncbi:MAG: hypothetical protein P1U57_04325 [Oleibacter sp.]|nr:hypothetical protein [Thalassolituus sp.]